MSSGKLIGFICEKHGYVNVEPHGQRICPKCGKENKGIAPYINLVSPDIDKQCKTEGTCVLNTDEARREANRNKAYNREKQHQQFRKGFENQIRRII